MAKTVLIGLIVLFVAAACDPMYEMNIENATTQTLTVHEIDRSGDHQYTIGPNETRMSTWWHPRNDSDEERMTIKALATDGKVVFCRRFTRSEAKGDFEWTVRITAGPVNC